MAGKGTITKKDIIEEEALRWGDDYAKEIKKAVKAQGELLVQAKEMMVIYAQYNKAKGMAEFISLKQQEALATMEALNAIKKEEAAMLSAEKVRQQKLKTLKDELAVQSQKNKNSKVTQSNAEKERLGEIKLDKARENAVDTFNRQNTAYALLNKRRNEAQAILGNLLSAEIKNTAEIKKAQIEFEKLDARVKSVDAAIKNYSKNIGNYKSAFEGLSGTMRELFSTFGLVGGVALFGTIVKDIFSVIKDFDRQLIAVGKTTNISGENLKEFGREVIALGSKLDGITVDGLIASAEVAGQLGVTGTENILKFSTAIEKLKLTSNIISDEQVGQFAKFIEVSSDSFENADRLASVITQLGNSFATTESEVLANSTEIQKGIAVYNTSAQGVLALGAATSTLGSEAEASRSAIQSTFSVINKAIATGANLESVLKLTGLTQKELSKQFKQDATGVFQKFIKGLSDAKAEGQNLALVLNDVDITEKRAFTVVGALAANYGILESAMSQANEEYKLNEALNKEVAAASESLASIVGDIRDKWEAYILQANNASEGSEKLAKVLKFLRDNLSNIIDYVIKGGSVLLTYLGVTRAISFATSAWTAIQAAATAAQLRFALSTGIGTQSILAQAAAARAATVAQTGLNVAVSATPWGVILGALAAIVVAYHVFNDTLSEVEESQERVTEAAIRAKKQAQESSEAHIAFYNKRLTQIKEEYELRKKANGESIALTKEEIGALKKVAEIAVESNQMQMQANSRLLEQIKKESAEKIKVLEEEAVKARAIANDVPRAGSELAASRAESRVIREKEEALIRRNNLVIANNAMVEENKKFREDVSKLDREALVKDTEYKAELDKKALARERKRLKDLYDANKKAEEDRYKLMQFRLQTVIDVEKEILTNEKASFDDRMDALEDSNNLMSSKITESLAYDLKQLGKYNENSGKFVRELSDTEIKSLIQTGVTKKKLTDEQQRIYETYQANQTALAKKGEEDRQKLIDNEINVRKKLIDQEIMIRDTRTQKALATENNIYKSALAQAKGNFFLIEQATKEHEERIFAIKRAATLKALKLQIDDMQSQLDSNDKKDAKDQASTEERIKLANSLANAQILYSNLSTEAYVSDVMTKEEREAIFAASVRQLSEDLTNSLSDFANAIFDTRISNIDEEIRKNDEYYADLIEKAGNDAAQKKLLEDDAEKKRKKLEAEKRKEQQKQAIFNKAMAVMQTGILTAQSIMKGFADSGYVGAILAAAVGAVQLATILATPIPKYKDGRKDGPKEVAIINDGVSNGNYVQEVIERKNGGVEVPTGKNRLVQLYEGDTVHRSVSEFNKLQRASFMASLNMEGQKLNDYQASQMFNYSFDQLEDKIEQGIAKGFKNAKNNVIINMPKIDISHEIWKSKNTNWS